MRKSINVFIAVLVLAVPLKVFASDDVVVDGKSIKLDYTLTVDNKQIESSVGKQPLEVVLGSKSIIPGLEKGLIGMHVGEEKIITVDPKDAYGDVNAKMLKDFPKTSMPKGLELKPGMVLQANAPDGNSFPATIKEVKGATVTLDFNHPLAGKQLQFKVKVLGVSVPSATAVVPAVPVKK